MGCESWQTQWAGRPPWRFWRKMLLNGFSRGFDGGVTEIWMSMSSVHAESVSTRNACTPSAMRWLSSLMLE